jgi:hypothetical protein
LFFWPPSESGFGVDAHIENPAAVEAAPATTPQIAHVDESPRDSLRDAIAPRTVLLGVGVLVLQLAFILSYIGAFHAPVPHRIPIVVVAPGGAAQQFADRLNALPGDPLEVTTSTDESAARNDLRTGQTSAVYLPDPGGGHDTVLVASAGGTSASEAVAEILGRVEQQQHRPVTVEDVVPLQSGDARGLSGFYLVVGWAVGGYLFAAMLGMAKGARPATLARAVWRLTATLPYALASGFGGAVIAGPVLGALDGPLGVLTGVGTLVVLAAATVTMAFQLLFGILGIAATIIVFVILGNPSAGGAYQPALLPTFWRDLNHALPNGAGTDAVRRIVYFGGHGVTGPLLVLVAWALGGLIVALLAATVIKRAKARAADVEAQLLAELAAAVHTAGSHLKGQAQPRSHRRQRGRHEA